MQAVEADIALGEAGTVVQSAHTALAGGTGLIVIAQDVGLGSIAIVGALLSIGTAVISLANAPAFVAGYWHWAPLLQIAAGVLGLKIGERIGAAKHYRAFLDAAHRRPWPHAIRSRRTRSSCRLIPRLALAAGSVPRAPALAATD